MTDLKQELRRRMRRRRAGLPLDERWAASALIVQRLAELCRLRRFQRVAAFLATPDEVNLDPLLEHLLHSGATVVVPRGAPAHEAPFAGAPFHELRSLHDTVTGAFGVREPRDLPGTRSCAANEVDVVLVPGLAFDIEGMRLGQGGGWYDRVLPQAALSIGVCFDCQVVARVPREPHDAPVSAVVTEDRVIDMDGRLRLDLRGVV